MVNVAVVVHVNEKVSGDRLVLNPPVEYLDEVAEVDAIGATEMDFGPEFVDDIPAFLWQLLWHRLGSG